MPDDFIPDDFILTAITRDPLVAARCDAAGVDRIGVDIERLGKVERQGSVGNVRISDHQLDHLNGLRPVVRRAALFARLNPPHDGAGAEVDQAIGCGATSLMLPYFKTAHEVETFVRLVDGRASTTLLLESITAVVRLHEILCVAGIDDVVIGLNDLSLSCGAFSVFEFLASDVMDHVAATLRRHGVPFGFGGLARANDDTLPVSSDLVIAQHPRLGSQAAWLSRSFFGSDPGSMDISAEVAALRARLAYWKSQPMKELERQRDAIRLGVAALRDAR